MADDFTGKPSISSVTSRGRCTGCRKPPGSFSTMPSSMPATARQPELSATPHHPNAPPKRRVLLCTQVRWPPQRIDTPCGSLIELEDATRWDDYYLAIELPPRAPHTCQELYRHTTLPNLSKIFALGQKFRASATEAPERMDFQQTPTTGQLLQASSKASS